MSVKVMAAVFECNMPELKTDKGATVSDSSCKFVLLALADHASEDGEGCYPGVRRICKKTNLSTQTVVNALNALRHNGFTQLEGQSKRKTFNYTILTSRIAEFQWVESGDSNGQNTTVPATRAKPSLTVPPTPTKNEEDEERTAEIGKVFKTYQSEIGVITPMIADSIDGWIKDGFPLKWLCDAFQESSAQGKRSWKYCEAIIKRWDAQGSQEAMTKPQGKPNTYKPRDLIQERYGGIMEWLKEAQENDNTSTNGSIDGANRSGVSQLKA